MNRPSILRTGIIGAIITAICCFTPLLIWPLSVVGLAGATAYLDIVLLPLLALFIAMAILGYVRKRAR